MAEAKRVGLTEKDIAKVEKKRAKKQAQKLKKKQKKLSSNDLQTEPAAKGGNLVAETPQPIKDLVIPISKNKKKNEVKGLGKKQKKLSSNDLQTEPAPEGGNLVVETPQPTKNVVIPTSKNKKKNEVEGLDKVKKVRDPAAEAATVFVGNLPINTKRVQLIRLFQPYGTVQSIRLRTAGGKQLFKHKQRKNASSLNAYVLLDSADVAEKALALNGTEFKAKHLRVTPASKAGDGLDGHSNEGDRKRTVFVGNLKYTADEEKLREIFSSCGEIEYIRCLQDGEKGCKGVAFVCYKKADAVGLALELSGTLLDDRPINVERYSVDKLGAKQARDVATNSQSNPKSAQNKTGATKRIAKKNNKQNEKTAKPTTVKKKKSEYRGVKVDGIKKSKNKPKKNGNNSLKAMAKKIAPKPK
ncbi:nucleolar protein 12 [Scaptodrosophila lebanonensis]|uniref:Nucleolar protein 12 n=1 Tax=Drosophila lebanonensis TaxID=7225 RepID=A0A6J2T664_DROLE|nr:nucleolar protein 12 [Scaptodrosophila lebanonensis]